MPNAHTHAPCEDAVCDGTMHKVYDVMQARLTTVEAEEAQQKEELNTFYLMWAGRGALHAHHLAVPSLCCATRAHLPYCL